MTDTGIISLLAVGDVGPDREDPESLFERVAPTIQEADISFCQLERILSDRGNLQVQIKAHHSRVDPANVSALTFAGFDILSFASNHCMDWGADAFLDTIDLLREKGIEVVGVGKNIREARSPAIIHRKGTRIAFLAYNSVVPRGYQAEADTPGCAPLRAKTFYEQVDWQAGTPPKIISFTEPKDLEALVEDINRVRPLADIVVLSMHWGVHFAPSIIAMYQKEAGHAAIDAGADIVIGHHAHILKGVEVYKGKAIFYSLGNFAFDVPAAFVLKDKGYQNLRERYPWDVDPEYIGYGYPPDSRKTLLVRCIISDKRIQRVSFLPAHINKYAQPEILDPSDARFGDVVAYMERISREQKLDVRFVVEDNKVVVHP